MSPTKTDGALGQAADFLMAWPGDRIHLTAIDPNSSKIVGRTFEKDAASRDRLIRWMRRGVSTGRGLYFSVNGLRVALNAARAKASLNEVDMLHAFHVDVDVDKAITDATRFEIAKADLLERIKSDPLAPSVIVDSGNGFGVFWLLDKPIPVTAENRDLLTRINIGLRDRLGGDAAQNLDRVMRVPFTMNFPNAAKRKRNRPTVPTRLVADQRDFLSYRVADFRPAPTEAVATADDPVEIPKNVDLNRLDPAFAELLKKSADGGGRYGDGSRSAYVYAMACELRRAGFSDGEIIWVITNPDFRVSEHILDQKQRDPEAQAMRVIRSMNKNGVSAEPSAEQDFAGEREQRRERALVSTSAASIEPENLSFIWKDRFARGTQVVLAGEGGKFKSQIMYSFMATISTGGLWPDRKTKAQRGWCVILSAEESARTMIVPRLAAAGADLRMIEIVQAVRDEKGNEGKFNLERDLGALKELCDDLAEREIDGRKYPVAMIGIDPASSYMGGDLDARHNTKVRHVLDPLSRLAEQVGCVVLNITHFRKGSGDKAVHKIMDSVAFVNAPRAAFGVFDDPEDVDGGMVFVVVKTNIGPGPGVLPGFKYRGANVVTHLKDHRDKKPISAPRVVWCGETEATADSIARQENERGAPKLDDAKQFLADLLSGGPRPVTEAKDAADAEGISASTLLEAKRRLGVKATRDGFGAPWHWSLPPQSVGSGT